MLIFQKKSSLLFNFFWKKTSQKVIAYKPLLIKQNECILWTQNSYRNVGRWIYPFLFIKITFLITKAHPLKKLIDKVSFNWKEHMYEHKSANKDFPYRKQ